MAAVDKHLGVGGELLDFIKSLGSTLVGSPVDFLTRMHTKIRESMLENVLRQDRARLHRNRKGWFRPGARGGAGRTGANKK
jgi:hypothetical protein